VQTQVAELSGATLEAPGIVKRNGVYWLFASHTSGWAPNPSAFPSPPLLSLLLSHPHPRPHLDKYFSAPALSGTWSAQADIAPEANRTYFSQNNYDFPLGTNAIYMGDRWRPDLLGSSRYMWYPLSWATGKSPVALLAASAGAGQARRSDVAVAVRR
jgi:hypothetical protein